MLHSRGLNTKKKKKTKQSFKIQAQFERLLQKLNKTEIKENISYNFVLIQFFFTSLIPKRFIKKQKSFKVWKLDLKGILKLATHERAITRIPAEPNHKPVRKPFGTAQTLPPHVPFYASYHLLTPKFGVNP